SRVHRARLVGAVITTRRLRTPIIARSSTAGEIRQVRLGGGLVVPALAARAIPVEGRTAHQPVARSPKARRSSRLGEIALHGFGSLIEFHAKYWLWRIAQTVLFATLLAVANKTPRLIFAPSKNNPKQNESSDDRGQDKNAGYCHGPVSVLSI